MDENGQQTENITNENEQEENEQDEQEEHDKRHAAVIKELRKTFIIKATGKQPAEPDNQQNSYLDTSILRFMLVATIIAGIVLASGFPDYARMISTIASGLAIIIIGYRIYH